MVSAFDSWTSGQGSIPGCVPITRYLFLLLFFQLYNADLIATSTKTSMWDYENSSVVTYPFYFINWHYILKKTNCMQIIKKKFYAGRLPAIALKSVIVVETHKPKIIICGTSRDQCDVVICGMVKYRILSKYWKRTINKCWSFRRENWNIFGLARMRSDKTFE